ncbi:MAG TPA: Crp/Fnr family transcriptional regulator [Thermodesulfovibrionales bacterium]|nr:Crp/Fnr family transcriptional regulator [Thermodesulfovibrionales bacterium]
MMDIRSFLAHTFLFHSFTDKETALLTASTSLKSVNKGEQIFSEGLEATAFFIVVSGKVKIYKLSPDGKEYTLHIHGPGEPVAEAAIFDSMTYPAFCTALEDATLVRISREGFLDLIKKYPELSLKIMSGYSKRLRQFVAKIEELTVKDMKSRLARYLLENSVVENGKTVCRLTHSKKELSSLLGTIPETFSRTLAFFKQQKFIVEKENTIIISEPEKLRIFAE